MKAVILAAGYATRLYPLTENFPKPLLEIGGKTIMDRLVADVSEINLIDEIVVISNHKFINEFIKWKENADYPVKITILDDGSTDNENRLGAVCDITFAIDKCKINDDILVMAGDNVLDFSLKEFCEYSDNKNSSCIMCHEENDIERLRKTGVILIDENNRVLSMEEKPKEPKSRYAVPPFYIYRKNDLHIIDECIKNGCKTDAPGSLIQEMCSITNIYAYKMPGKRYDIGDIESYRQVNKIYGVDVC